MKGTQLFLTLVINSSEASRNIKSVFAPLVAFVSTITQRLYSLTYLCFSFQLAVECGPLIPPASGTFEPARCIQVNSNVFRDKCHLKCHVGYAISDVSQGILTCGSRGRWEGTLATCQREYNYARYTEYDLQVLIFKRLSPEKKQAHKFAFDTQTENAVFFTSLFLNFKSSYQLHFWAIWAKQLITMLSSSMFS